MLTKIAESYASGVQIARDAIAEQKGESLLDKSAAEEQGNAIVAEFVKQASLRYDARFEAFEDAVGMLKEAGHDKAAEALAEAAEAEAEDTNAEAMSEEDPDEEVAIAAAVEGATKVIAEEIGADMSDPEQAAAVEEAAEEAVAEALEGTEEIAAE